MALAAVLGGLAFVGVVIALVLYLADRPARLQRYRIEQAVDDAAFRIYQHARDALQRMLEVARQDQEGRR